MKRMNIDQTYQDHEKILWDRAWSFASSTGHPVEDLVSVGRSAFMRAWKGYDPGRGGAFGTLFYQVLNRELARYVGKYRPSEREAPEEGSLFTNPDPTSRMSVEELLAEVSREAREVLTLLIQAPAEILGVFGWSNPKALRGRVRTYLREERGWTWRKIDEVMREMRKAVASL
jgi:hypothetical protein